MTRQITAMADLELIRAVKVESEAYDRAFLDAVEQELHRRRISVADIVKTVRVAQNDEQDTSCTVEQAMSEIGDERALWSLCRMTNCLEESFVIQREYKGWVAHYYEEDAYRGSYFFDTATDLKQALSPFLLLSDWGKTVSAPHDLNLWQPVFQSRSPAYLTKMSADLHAEHIRHTVQTPLFSGNKKGILTILTAKSDLEQAARVVRTTENKLQELYDHAEQLGRGEDREQELKIYDWLVELVPDNPAVFYNRGQILLALGRLDDATASFAEAVMLGLPEIESALKLNPHRSNLSRIAGRINPLLGLAVLAGQSEHASQAPSYPDYIDDVEILLTRIVEQSPNKMTALQCLAAIAELKDDPNAARRFYKKILDIDPGDETARTHLAYLGQVETDDKDQGDT